MDIKLSDYQVGVKNVSFMISFKVMNSLKNNSVVDFYFPSKGTFVIGSNFSCNLNSNNTSSAINCTYELLKRLIHVYLPASVPSSTILNFTITDCYTSPSNTRPISFPSIQTLTSSSNLV